MRHTRFWCALGVLAIAIAAGCATTKPPAAAASGKDEYEARLRGQVQQQVAEVNRDQESAKNRVVKRHPFYLKEYSVYSEPSAELEVIMRPQEARTRPFLADVKLAKTLYATRLQKRAKDAKADTAFFRDTGMETLTFELRNGDWKQVGSLFVADKSEEYVNGEWMPRREEVKRVFREEEDTEGWWIWRKVKKWVGRD